MDLVDFLFTRSNLAPLPCALALLLTPACGDLGEPGDSGESSSETDVETGGDATEGMGSSGEATEDPTENSTEDPTDDPTEDPTDDPTEDPTEDGPEPVIPTPTGACPEITEGTLTFNPAGVGKPREARIWIDEDAAAAQDGPVVFYWHGTGSSTNEAPYGLSNAGVEAFKAAGGMVVAAVADPDAGTFPWWLTIGEQEDDLLLADEVLGCLDEQWGVDPTRIHAIGMSAGGLHTTQMSYRRSAYIASVVTYSGGIGIQGVPASQNPENRFAAMIYHGGASDNVVISFQLASETYLDDLLMNDHFAFICDHGNGHTIPTDAISSTLQFFSKHPYGVRPSPYADELPGGFPDYCSL